MPDLLLRRSTIAILALVMSALPAAAGRLPSASPAGDGTAAEGGVRVAQGGCSAAASQAAAQSGGQVLSVQTAQRGGQTVCIVTVLIPARDGNRPRRQTITVPQ